MLSTRALITMLLGAVCASMFASAEGRAETTISLGSLLQEMTDREALARFPSPRYTCRQSSSYDRDSVSSDDASTWYANWDRSQFVRTEKRAERTEYVLHDQQGPGAIVRFWATWHGPSGQPFSNGVLRFYFDGETEPRIAGPISEVLDGGALTTPPLSQGVSPLTEYAQRGHNLYLPIPYAKSCKITYSTDVPVDRGARQGEALYYQINYRTYEAGTAVESFSMDALAAAKELLDATNQQLVQERRAVASQWRSAGPADGALQLPPGAASQPLRLDGAGAIRALQCRVEAEDTEQALRSTILEIAFDGDRTVWCPLGDFYGVGYRPSASQTWYTQTSAQGLMSCWWIMPFQQSAVIKLHNLGDQPVTLRDAAAHYSDWDWDNRSMYFHATWRQLTEINTRSSQGMDGNGAFDVNYVTAQGQGVYLGDTLTVYNARDAWWGEGDEKIYVDGESFPSHFGTGTEDYYGYAWCRPELFSAPFHAQPTGEGNQLGGLSVNSRYRALDAIPFQEALRFDMELWHWQETKVNYAPTTFWYAMRDATSNVQPDPETAKLPVGRGWAAMAAPSRRVEGAIEGESLPVVRSTGGHVRPQFTVIDWSGGAQLWWTDAADGDTLTLQFTAPETARYRVQADLTKANDYGIVKLSIDDAPGKTLDRYHPSVQHDVIELGELRLTRGDHRLSVEVVGANDKAIPRRMFGLDYLKLEKVEN